METIRNDFTYCQYTSRYKCNKTQFHKGGNGGDNNNLYHSLPSEWFVFVLNNNLIFVSCSSTTSLLGSHILTYSRPSISVGV